MTKYEVTMRMTLEIEGKTTEIEIVDGIRDVFLGRKVTSQEGARFDGLFIVEAKEMSE